MRSFFYRLISLALRVGCPLFILYVANPVVLGKYYLFTTFFTFAVFFASLEAAVPFSRRYLQAVGEQGKRRAFSSFILSQVIVAGVLAVPLSVFFAMTNGISAWTGLLFFVTLAAGACSNETGRFFWNVGLGETATRRDVLRSLVFVIAIIASVSYSHEVVSAVSLGLIAAADLGLLFREQQRWGTSWKPRTGPPRHRARRWRGRLARVVISMKTSVPQVVHLQILSIQPFFERSLIERGLGLAVVGSYSFQYAIMQAGVSLLLMPAVADTRRSILSARSAPEYAEAHRRSLALLGRVFAIAGVCAIATYFVVPLLVTFMKKTIAVEPLVLATGLLSAVASTYTSAIAPLYANQRRLLAANLCTLACMLPMAAVLGMSVLGGRQIGPYVLAAIAAVALCQMGVRVWFHSRNPAFPPNEARS